MEKSQTKGEFQLSYEFQAPRELVFNAFANAEALNAWWGPVECKNSVVSLDFRVGGIFHFKMENNGQVSYGRFLFRDIQAPDMLEFTNAFADEQANVVKAPFDIQLPNEILYRMVFTEKEGKTTINMTGTPVYASPEQDAGFQSISEDMQKGFGATFDQLQFYLRHQQG
jgi:uncharacterized protein YndB with AHSA1/START domain